MRGVVRGSVAAVFRPGPAIPRPGPPLTELREALELLLLRFSLLLPGCLLLPPGFGSGLAGLRRLEVELEPRMVTVAGRAVPRPPLVSVVDTDFCFSLTVLAARGEDLLRERVDDAILGLLPPLRLLIGFRSPNKLLLFLGLTIVPEEEDRPSSFPFRRFFVISLERSLILFRVPLGLSGGRLVAREAEVAGREAGLAASEGRELARLARLPVPAVAPAPLDSRSNTLEPAVTDWDCGKAPRRGSLLELERESRSISEFFRVTGFLRSLRLWPGRILPWPVRPSSACSTLIMGTVVRYFPSTSWES